MTDQTRHPWLKLLIEVGPLVVFFAVNARAGIFAGTGAFMVAIALSLGASYWLHKKLPVMPLVTAVIVFVFGSLTLILQDATFIKLKPTIVYSLFATVLLGGLAWNKTFIEPLLGPVMELTDTGWRRLSLYWGVFFVAMAIVNEFVWRNFSTDFWVNFKLFGFLPLSFVFALATVPIMNRYAVAEEKE